MQRIFRPESDISSSRLPWKLPSMRPTWIAVPKGTIDTASVAINPNRFAYKARARSRLCFFTWKIHGVNVAAFPGEAHRKRVAQKESSKDDVVTERGSRSRWRRRSLRLIRCNRRVLRLLSRRPLFHPLIRYFPWPFPSPAPPARW